MFTQTYEGVKSGGGVTSGWAMAFCLDRPGSNLRMDVVGFFWFRIAFNLFSLWVGLFLIMCKIMVHTPTYSFLSPSIIYRCKIYQSQSNNVPKNGKNLPLKRPERAHIIKKPMNVAVLRFKMTLLGPTAVAVAWTTPGSGRSSLCHQYNKKLESTFSSALRSDSTDPFKFRIRAILNAIKLRWPLL